jgi:MarR family transcriptional regulator, transcriptional regulator for hemolysin
MHSGAERIAEPAADGAPPAAADVDLLLRFAGRRTKAIAGELLAPWDLTPRQFGILSWIVTEQPSTQNRIGNRAGVDRTTMTHLINRLEQRGLVERRPDPDDRRAYRVTATAAGRKLILEDCADIPLRVQDRLLQRLSPQQREALRDLLIEVAAPLPGGPDLIERAEDDAPNAAVHRWVDRADDGAGSEPV